MSAVAASAGFVDFHGLYAYAPQCYQSARCVALCYSLCPSFLTTLFTSDSRTLRAQCQYLVRVLVRAPSCVATECVLMAPDGLYPVLPCHPVLSCIDFVLTRVCTWACAVFGFGLCAGVWGACKGLCSIHSLCPYASRLLSALSVMLFWLVVSSIVAGSAVRDHACCSNLTRVP